jgi:predicted secreted Zn-dependent protease
MTAGTASLIVALVALSGCASHPSRLDLGKVPTGVVVDAQVQYYDVSAASLSDLRRAMVILGPRWEGRSYQAVTESRFRWEYLPENKGPLACEPARVRVTVQTMVTFPRWQPLAEPDSSLLEWWNQLSVGLMEHERGHARLSLKTAGDIARSLEEMSAGPCNELEGRVSAAGERHISVERRLQSEYDRSTRHGATQVEQAARLRSP